MTRRATSLVEVLVVAALAAVFMSALYLFWIASTRQTVDLEARVAALSRAQGALAPLVREIQLARRVLVPAPGAPAQASCLFVNADGVVISVDLDPDARLMRTVPGSGRRTVLADGVAFLACRVPAPPPGRDPELVHLTVGVSGPNERPIHLVTSARVRAEEPRCPTAR